MVSVGKHNPPPSKREKKSFDIYNSLDDGNYARRRGHRRQALTTALSILVTVPRQPRSTFDLLCSLIPHAGSNLEFTEHPEP